MTTGKTFAVRCRLLKCSFCLEKQARLRQVAAAVSLPERMIGISLIADETSSMPIKQARARMQDIRQGLKRRNQPMGEYCWTIEHNPRGTGYHTHMLQRGGYIRQSLLQSACESAGAGIPYIKAIKGAEQTVAGYGLKGFQASGYGYKGFGDDSLARDALAMNGGRLDHHSRAFYQVAGITVPVKEAERNAQKILYGLRGRDTVIGTESYIRTLAEGLRLEAVRHDVGLQEKIWFDGLVQESL
jgi:hypothetical protein